MVKYALKIGENGRILSATFPRFAQDADLIVESLPEGDITDYRYVDGTFCYDPIPLEEQEPVPSQMDRIEAQVIYTAMMTDTLLEV